MFRKEAFFIVDDLSIEFVFSRYKDDVYRFLVFYTRSTDVDDLIQETFVRVLQKFHTYDAQRDMRTWLIGIARNVAIDEYRKKQRYQTWSIDDLPWLRSPHRSPEESAEIKDIGLQLLDVIHSLAENYRDVIVLRLLEELSAGETAKILGWTVTRVNVTYFRALRKVKEHYDDIERTANLLERTV